MTLEERLKRAESGRQIAYKGADGSVTYMGDDSRPLPTVKSSSLEDQRLAENVGGVQSWAQQVSQFAAQPQGDVQQQNDTAARLQQQANQYLDFFNANRGTYDDKTVDSMLSTLERGGRTLGQTHDRLNGDGVYRPQPRDLSVLDDNQRQVIYQGLPQSSDFGTGSQYRSTYQPGKEYFSRFDDMWYDTGYGDILYDFINRNPDAMNKYMSTREWNTLAGVGMAQTQLGEMTDGEIALFNYLYAQDEARGDKAHAGAYQYIQDLNSGLNARQRQRGEATAAQFAQEHPHLADAGSILMSPMRGVSYLGQTADYLTDGKVDQNAGYNQYTYIPTAIRGQRSQDIEKKWGGVGSFLYGTGMSMGDFLLNTGITGGSQALTLGIMGTGAAADSVISAKDRGLSDNQAFALGTIAGLAEVATEKVSLEALLKPDWEKGVLNYVIKNAVAEGSEEVASDAINLLADVLISKDKSEWAQSIQAYMAQGYSESEATGLAVKDQALSMGVDFLGGALSGGIMSGVSGAGHVMTNYQSGRQFNSMDLSAEDVQAFIDEGLSSAPNTQAYKLANRAQQKLEAGKTLTDYELGSLYQANVRAVGMDSGTADPLEQAARDVAAREMAQEAAQEPAQAPVPQAVQNTDQAARTAQEAAQGAAEAIQRAKADTEIVGRDDSARRSAGSGPVTDGAPSGRALQTDTAARDITAQQRTAAMENANALVRAAATFGESGRKAFGTAWDGQQSAERYYAGFAVWYQAGLTGKAQNQVRGPYAGNLSQDQRYAAYTAGQNDAAASLAKEKAAAPYAKTAGTEAGLYDAGELNADTAGRVDAAAKLLGARVYMVDSVADGRANGQYSGSDILIARDAVNPEAQVFGHEITHRVQELAPEAYRVFREAALENMADSATRSKINDYQAQGLTIQYEAAMDDVAADYAGQLMEDGGVLDEFIDRHRTDKTLLEKLRDAFRSLWQKLTGAEKRKAQTAEGKLSAALDAAAERAGSLSQAAPDSSFAEGTEGQGSEGANGSKYSLKGATITKTYNQLLRENDALRERVEYWRGQTKTTKEVTVDKKAVEKASKDIIKEYGAGIDDRDLSGRLQALYNHMARTWYANGEVENSDVWKGAEEIARDIAGGAVEEWSLDSEFPGLKEKLRDTRISVGREYDGDIQNENFRREYRGKLNLTSKEGTNVDTVYSELSEAYPGLFPADITHPADQLEQIMSVADSLYTVEEQSRFSGQMEEAVTGITNEIVEKFMDLPLTKGTFADWQAMKMDKLRSENREAVQNAIAKERVAREKQVNELKKKYKARTDEGRERQKASDLRKKIDRHAKSLSGKLLHPTDKAHIPEELRGPVAKVLESINLESQYTIDPDTAHYAQRKDGKRGGLTGKHLTGDEEARGILTKRTQAFLELKQKYADINENGGDLVIDPTLLGSEEGSIDAVIAMGDTRIADMNSQQLNTVWQVLKSVEHSVSTEGKTLNQAKYERTSQWADALKRDTATRRDKRTLTERHMTLDLETPYTFFSHFGQAGKDMYRTLRDAQDRQQVLTNQVADAVEKAIAGDAKNAAKVIEKTVKELEKKTGDFTTEGGQKLTLSTSQVMELYELSKREQALEHLLIGGIVQPEIRGTKVRRGTEAIHLTANDLANITGTLTAEEKRIADGLQKIASTILSDMGNEASMTAYGYKKFTEKNYWPIRSAREALHSNIEKGGDNTRSIKNIGMAQATKPHANNQVDIGSIFDTFARHAGDMVDYAAWLVPMEDLNRVYNYQYRDGDGNITDDVKKLLDRKGGAGSQKYWHNLMEDIQNGIKAKSDSPFVDTFSRGVGSFKASSVGGNIRVIVQQPTALFRAAAVMNPADMAAGLAKGATKGFGWQKAKQYSPIAMRKDAGGFDISSPGTMKETLFGKTGTVDKINDFLGKGAGAADAWTWGKLWNASEWQVARQHKELTKGSKAFYEEVNRVFTDMIDQTQVVDGILQRANIMRTSNAMGQQATSFMGEPIMSLNLTMRAWDQLRNEQDSKKRGKAIKNFGRAVTALTVTAAANAVAQSLIDAIRDDDKDKKYWERFQTAFTGFDGEEETPWEKAWAAVMEGNFGSNLNPAGQIPYIKDIQSMIQGYDVSRTELSVIQDLVENGQNFIKSADGHGAKTQAYALNKLLASAAKVFGLPVANLERDLWAGYRTFAIETGNLPLQYEMEKAIYNIGSEKNKIRFADIMYRALEAGEMDTYLHIRDDMMRMTPKVDGTSLDSAMKSRYKSHLEKDPDYTLPQRSLDLLGIRTKLDNTKKEDTFGPDDLDNETYQTYAGKRADSWRSMSSNIAGSNLYKQLSDAEKDKAMDYAWEYAHQTALAEASGGKYKPSAEWIADAQEAKKRGVQPWEFALHKTAYGTDAAYNALENGNLDEYKTLRGEYMDVLGKDGTSVDTAMRSEYEDKLEENPRYTLNQAAMDLIGIHPSGSSDEDSFGADDLERAAYDAYTVQRAETYRETVDYIEDLPSYRDMDQATRDKLVSMAYAMAHQTALADNSDGQYSPTYTWVNDALDAQENAGIENGEFILWRTAYNSAFSDKDANNKPIKGREKKDKVKAWLLSQEDLTPAQRAYLWGTEYKSAW